MMYVVQIKNPDKLGVKGLSAVDLFLSKDLFVKAAPYWITDTPKYVELYAKKSIAQADMRAFISRWNASTNATLSASDCAVVSSDILNSGKRWW